MYSFQSSINNIYHISVGAILVDQSGKIACHHFTHVIDDETGVEYSDFYILMRESLELNESLEQAVERGLMEEFGARGKIERYLGPISTEILRGKYVMKKTTLYFLVILDSFDPLKRRDDDPERGSDIEWYAVNELIARIKQRVVDNPRPDLNEVEILERAKPYLD